MLKVLVEDEFLRITSTKFELVDGLLLRKGAWTEESLKEWKNSLGQDSCG